MQSVGTLAAFAAGVLRTIVGRGVGALRVLLGCAVGELRVFWTSTAAPLSAALGLGPLHSRYIGGVRVLGLRDIPRIDGC